MGQYPLSKKCTVCKKDTLLTEYYNKASSKDGKYSRCRSCDQIARKAWRTKHPIRSKESARRRQLKFVYGITEEDYQRMLVEQGGACAICQATENKYAGEFRSFAIDHNHDTGDIRGLLCNQCNRGLGMLGDTVESLNRVVAYLERSTV